MSDEDLSGIGFLAGCMNTPAWSSGYTVWPMRGSCLHVQQKPGSELLE